MKISQLESLSKMAKNGNLGNPEINAWKKPFKKTPKVGKTQFESLKNCKSVQKCPKPSKVIYNLSVEASVVAKKS